MSVDPTWQIHRQLELLADMVGSGKAHPLVALEVGGPRKVGSAEAQAAPATIRKMRDANACGPMAPLVSRPVDPDIQTAGFVEWTPGTG